LLPIFLVAILAAQDKSNTLTLTQTIPLTGETFHVQGIDTNNSLLWVTSVDTKAKRGLLFEYKLPEGRLLRSVEIHDGIRYHPGGMMADGESLWIPVAEYKRDSTAVIQRRNKRTLALESQFLVNDHIGAIAVAPEGLIGANWDARDLYVWDRTGKQIRKMANSSQVAFQDMKFDRGQLVGGGLRPDKSGEIVWMEWPSLKVVKRLPAGRTDRGIAYTHEGMAIRANKLWFLPEDGPSRLFGFTLH
jgi:hypothetical protein